MAHGGVVWRVLRTAILVTNIVAAGSWNAGAQIKWKQIPDMPGARWEPGAVVIDEKLYVFGGEHRGLPNCPWGTTTKAVKYE